ncbi:MAG: phenylalanine--tRNA ligase subunit beta [Bacteroidetes bacterium GWE2_39_28]|nr:MAG: phenylalanine--tRNA ligase subunit beta [Bacteroidetes bacterium GWE2_39_28]OFY15611.1 MAG: phenylalanine--tRNA ligase subunit beta [Bacteroidetes bacterium GWF2_39_10]OFZ08620.1 MAG: phenylalanine--tRNA ligase subunit beta [Bacteroidetes bacterium RIFOXYB2_FULL_39_7]OFZ11853.1 MAG: phenylalanine--tRNA ligase subunit beta [Bacteroidetes bacterium RIFOXYC2_FULL_39_11]HCT94121.1 phenylalanine--tRNA ligase subunit beta [Rikenellaceae bacterium]
MKISYNWLKRYINVNLAPEELASILTSIGLEVEAMEEAEDIPGGLAGVFVGSVMECSKHPDADKLSLTKVDAGQGELLQIVCGAPNVAAGQKVLVATVGTTLTFSNGEEVKIKRSKIRGVESMGMICAEDELGIGDSHDGILVLPDSAVVGTSAKDYLKLESDTVFEIGLTPNRIDAASHMGVARDLYAYLKYHGYEVSLNFPSESQFNQLEKSNSGVKAAEIELVAPDGAPKYYGLTLDNIKVAPSPEWLQKALRAAGVRPINNVVDITNFILHETGHPLHAFDLEKVEGGKVVVRRAANGEKFVTLDGVAREMSGEDLMICNAKSPMCLGGVFGGENSGVTESTTSIFLESAYFNPVSIRKSSKRHSLKTDASFRFERGANHEILSYALKRASILLAEIAGAKVVGEIKKACPVIIDRAVVSLDFSRMEDLIGKKIGAANILSIIGLLDYEILSSNNEYATVAVPGYRVDVTRECDVVEDVLRIYGYNNIELPERMSASLTPGIKPDPERIRELSANLLVNNGFYEMMNNSLTKGDYYQKLKSYPAENLVKILNPLSSDLNSMRQTLLLNGLEVVAYNINRQQNDLKLFEFGNVYSYIPEGGDEKLKDYKESAKLSLVVTGPGYAYWRGKRAASSYFMLKGYLEALLKRFGVNLYDLDYSSAPADIFVEGMEILTKGGKRVAVMGTISNMLLKQFDIKQPVFAAEISWDVLLGIVRKKRVLYSELPKFPEVKRDLALLIDEKVSFSEIRATAFATEKKILKQVVLFDVYRGDKIPDGKKQYAISFTLQDLEKTLTDKYVEDVMNKLLTAFMNKFGATLR